jgi:hypothetical protein
MRGVISLRRGDEQTVNTEFPALIYTHSTERIEPTRHYPVLNYSLAMNNKQLIEFFVGLDWEVDGKQHKGGYLMNNKGGYPLNNMERWNQPITSKRIESMENSHKDTFDSTVDTRIDFMNHTLNLHFIQVVPYPNTTSTMCVCVLVMDFILLNIVFNR